MALDAYNAQYPLAYYEIGTPYTFYHSKDFCYTSTPATEEQILRFKGSLLRAKKQNYFEPKSGEWGKFERRIGVVIDKYISTNVPAPEKPMGILEVLFEEDGEFSIHKYGAEMQTVFFDDKELVPVFEKKGDDTYPVPGGDGTHPVPDKTTHPIPDKK